jgi:hypothetical protein
MWVLFSRAGPTVMCRNCQREIDRAVGLLSVGGRRMVEIRRNCPDRFGVSATETSPFSDMCAALLLVAKLRRAERCLGRIDITTYGASAATVAAAVPALCELAVAAAER